MRSRGRWTERCAGRLFAAAMPLEGGEGGNDGGAADGRRGAFCAAISARPARKESACDIAIDALPWRLRGSDALVSDVETGTAVAREAAAIH